MNPQVLAGTPNFCASQNKALLMVQPTYRAKLATACQLPHQYDIQATPVNLP
jgi:hypothetical protein